MSHSGSKRSQRVAHVLRQELAPLIDGVGDPRIGFVTLTEVRPAPDFKSARVFVSVYGEDKQRVISIDALQESAGYLKRELARKSNLRYVPSLVFCLDEGLDRAERLDAVITAIADGDAEAPAEGRRDAVPVATERSGLAASRNALGEVAKESRRKRQDARKSQGNRNKTRARKKKGSR